MTFRLGEILSPGDLIHQFADAKGEWIELADDMNGQRGLLVWSMEDGNNTDCRDQAQHIIEVLNGYTTAFEAGRQAGIRETLNNAQYAAVEMGKRMERADSAKTQLSLLGHIAQSLHAEHPCWTHADVLVAITRSNNVDLIKLIGEALDQRTTD